jgi:hypothetical protein
VGLYDAFDYAYLSQRNGELKQKDYTLDINNRFYFETLERLNQHQVAYFLIGGLAVAYHGYARYTADMDIWLEPSEDNLEKLFAAMLGLGYEKENIEEIRVNRPLKHPTPIRLVDDNGVFKIDLMTNTFQNQFSWSECYQECEKFDLGSISVPVIHINHLIRLKENTTRLDHSMKDLVDAEELKKIRDRKE